MPVTTAALGTIISEPPVATGSPGSHRATEGDTNEHCTQHCDVVGVRASTACRDLDLPDDRHLVT